MWGVGLGDTEADARIHDLKKIILTNVLRQPLLSNVSCALVSQ